MKTRLPLLAAASLAFAGLTTLPNAEAATFRWANNGDVRALDPDTLDETFQNAFLGNIYEPLVRWNRQLQLEPALAETWEQISPTVWRFHLRPNVKFQDGTPFTADDVVFSFQRITSKTSQNGEQLTAVHAVRKIDDLTVDIETDGPDPILPREIFNMEIMSKAWCEAHDAAQPAIIGKDENYALQHAMGTGPFRVLSREPDRLTVLEKNPGWWDKPQGNLDRVEFNVIANDATRMAALFSGELDLVYSVPPQDIERIRHSPDLKVIMGPELRTIYLGMDQARDQLLNSNVTGKNPFKDVRVRRAFALAIDEDAIVSRIMRGQAKPTWVMWGPGVNGYDPALDHRPPLDLAESKRLLAEAGYANGFEVVLDCPNDRYVNDEAICTAIAPMLARIGVKVEVNARSKARFFADVLAPNYKTSFYLLGWSPTTYDALTALQINFATRDSHGFGGANVGGYSNPRIDALTRQIAVELDNNKRQAEIDQAAKIIQEDVAIIPLHQQVIVWAARKNIDVTQTADNFLRLNWVTVH